MEISTAFTQQVTGAGLVSTPLFPAATTSGVESRPLDVSVVMPCLDEAASVGRCVGAALGAFEACGFRGEVIVVDNGSSDGSAAVARAAGARVVTEPRRGYGSALRAGFAAAQGEVVVMADADSTYDFRQIGRLVDPVRAGDVDMMLGSRLDSARATMPFLHRTVGTPVLSMLISRLGGPRVTDSQSGFRAFRRAGLGALGLQASGMELASEMLLRAAQEGWRVSEVPVGYHKRIGESKLATIPDGFRHLRLIARMTLARTPARPAVPARATEPA